MLNDIGLIIWGCKGGHRVFCTNRVVDPNDPVIKNTIKDIRSFVRFNQNKLNVYALEFTAKYKIYTLYRSCNDSGTGAYVAITIYMPHRLRITNVREVLFSMMNSYFEEYIHPLTNTYLPGKYDDIAPFNKMLGNMAVIEGEKRKERTVSSMQDDTPQARLYDTVEEVDGYFLDPYRPEFFRCQEVMFMSREIFDRIPETLQFQRPPRIIEYVSPAEPMPVLVFDPMVRGLIKSITVNGISVAPDKPLEVGDLDMLDITFEKKHFEDLVIQGNVENLKAQGFIRQNAHNLEFVGSKIVMKSKRYSLTFTLNGSPVPDNLIACTLTPGKNIAYIRDAHCIVPGEYIASPLYWAVKQDRSDALVYSRTPIDMYRAYEEDGNVNVDTKIHTFSITVGDIRSEEIWAIIDGTQKVRITVKRNETNTISLQLPNEFTDDDITFRCGPDAVIRRNGQTVEVLSKDNFYTLKIADFNIEECHWYMVIQGQKVYPVNNVIELSSRDLLYVSQLYINEENYSFSERNHELLPQGFVVAAGIPGQPVEVNYHGRTFDVSKWNIFKQRPEIPKSKYDVGVKSVDNLEILSLKKKGSVVKPPKPQKLYVVLNNCKGGTFNDAPIKSKDETLTIVGDGTLRVKNNVCKIFNNAEKYRQNKSIDAQNRQNGFVVTYSNGGKDCQVEYLRKSGSGIIAKVCVFAIIGLIVMVALGFVAYKFRPEPSEEILKCHIVIDNPDNMVPGLDNLTKISVKSPKLVKEDDTPHIMVLMNSKYFKTKCNEDYNAYADSISHTVLNLKWANGYEENVTLGASEAIFKAIKDYQKGDQLPPVKIHIKPRIVQEIEDFDNQYRTSTDKEYFVQAKILADKDTHLQNIMIEKCWARLNSKGEDLDAMQAYLEFAPTSEEYKKQVYTKVDAIREATNNAEMQAQREAEIKRLTQSYIAALHSDKCELMTVNQALSWYNTLSDEEKGYTNIKNYIDAYKTFFEAKNVDDIGKLNKSRALFTQKQLKVVFGGYGKDRQTFNDWYSACGMSFTKPYEEGLIK